MRREFICPRCGEHCIIKYGQFNNIQRYKCKACSKTFSDVTSSELYYYKKGKILMDRYSKLMYESYTLRDIAYVMKISLKTAYLWRHKILNILNRTNKNNKLLGIIEAIDYRIMENNKGCRKIEKKEREKVHTIVSFDSMKRTNPVIMAVGRIDYRKVEKIILEIIEKDTIFFPKGNSYLEIFQRKHNEGIEIEDPNEFKKVNINLLIKIWLTRFHGVRTKYLEKYLGWFILDYKKYGVN